MRRALPMLLALALGVGSALLVACGGGGTKGGIPAASAGELKSQIADVRQAVDGHRCRDVSGQLSQVDTSIDNLPPTVDARLASSLRDASDKLRGAALRECATTTGTTATVTQPTQTQTTDTQTQTTDTQTQTQPQNTVTTPPPPPPPPVTTTPVPTTTTPVVPPAEPPPPATPGGGATPGATTTPVTP